MELALLLFGFVLGFALLCAFGISGGMVWWLPPAFFALYFLFATTFSRVRAEAGLPWGYGPSINPHGILTEVGGKTQYSLPSLTMLAYFQWFDMDYRCMAMPHHMEAMKIASSTGDPHTGRGRMNNRHLFFVVMWATLVGTMSSWFAILSIYYRYGAASGNVNNWRTNVGSTPFNLLADWIKNPTPFDFNRVYGMAAGMGITGFLMVMRTRFLCWPFHPVGYVIAETNTMYWLWCPTFVGWLIKALVLRYGGISAFRKGIPFFIGLLLGDYVIASLWALVGLYLNIPVYRAFPN